MTASKGLAEREHLLHPPRTAVALLDQPHAVERDGQLGRQVVRGAELIAWRLRVPRVGQRDVRVEPPDPGRAEHLLGQAAVLGLAADAREQDAVLPEGLRATEPQRE